MSDDTPAAWRTVAWWEEQSRQDAERIEALEAALRRIDAIIDSPASFNQDIEDVCRAVLAPEQDK